MQSRTPYCISVASQGLVNKCVIPHKMDSETIENKIVLAYPTD